MHGHSSDTIAQLARQIYERIEQGREDVKFRLPLPDGLSLLLTVNIRRDDYGQRWGVLFSNDALPCRLCQDDIRRMERERFGFNDLTRLLEKVAATVTQCRCVEAAQAERSGQRIERSPRRRINILSQDARGNAPALQPVRKKSSIRVNSVPDAAAPGESDYRGAALGAGSRHYPAASFRYESAEGGEIGVIFPQYVCETLAVCCDGSNWHGREVGGILVGYSHEGGAEGGARFIQNIVTDIIPVDSPDSSGAHFRLTENDWLFVQRLFDARYTAEGKVRLGWYHTHPTQGVFFSDQDIDFHTVFRQPHQCAVVVDPRRMEAGLFYWADYDRLAMASPLHFDLSSSISRQAGSQQAGSRQAGSRQAEGRASLLRRWGRRAGAIKNRISRALTREGARAKDKRERPVYDFLLKLAALVIAGLVLWQWGLSILRPTPAPPPPVTPGGASGQTGGNGAGVLSWAQPQILSLSLTEAFSEGKIQISLKSESPLAQVVYVRQRLQSGVEEWQVDAEKERKFFKDVFQITLSATATDDLISIQQGLAMAMLDGYWGAQTRNAFLTQALSRRDLMLNFSGGRSLQVQFR